jgi:Kef-type K+ transport system membrane component KefB
MQRLHNSPLSSNSAPFPLFSRRRRGSISQHGRRWLTWLAVLIVFAAIHDFSPLNSLGLGTAQAAPDAVATTEPDDTPHDTEAASSGDHDEKHSGGHEDPVAPVLAAIVLILLAAKVGGDVFERFGLPAVLGELIVGVLIGNFALLTGPITYMLSGTTDGWHILDPLHAPAEDAIGNVYNTGAMIKILAGIGVVLLLFEVGLESSVREMLSVGVSSFLVAILGVVAPMVMGYAAAVLVIGDIGWGDWEVPAFIGATLCATSVGITARVLKDLGRAQQTESKIILGAAVIDDVLGLLVLAIVSGAIAAAGLQGGDAAAGGLGFKIAKIILFAFGFLFGALILGRLNFPGTVFNAASFLRGHGILVAAALVFCFGFAWLSNVVGLAPIVGAFAAGLILEGAHYKELGDRENHSLEEALAPLSALLVPIFFVQMGIQVDLTSFGDRSVWLLAGSITVVAIIGKQVCSLGVREEGLNKMAVGLGMIPRGEVGLIFANEGRKLKDHLGGEIIDEGTYSAVVVMVMITTMVTPPLLKWSLSRDGGNSGRDAESS